MEIETDNRKASQGEKRRPRELVDKRILVIFRFFFFQMIFYYQTRERDHKIL